MKHAIDAELAADLVSHLEVMVRGGIPSPERAAALLRRLATAIRESERGFDQPNPPSAA